LAVVQLRGHDSIISLDRSLVFLIPRKDVTGLTNKVAGLKRYKLRPELVNELFAG